MPSWPASELDSVWPALELHLDLVATGSPELELHGTAAQRVSLKPAQQATADFQFSSRCDPARFTNSNYTDSELMVTAYQVALETESRGPLLLGLHEQIVKHQS